MNALPRREIRFSFSDSSRDRSEWLDLEGARNFVRELAATQDEVLRRQLLGHLWVVTPFSSGRWAGGWDRAAQWWREIRPSEDDDTLAYCSWVPQTAAAGAGPAAANTAPTPSNHATVTLGNDQLAELARLISGTTPPTPNKLAKFMGIPLEREFVGCGICPLTFSCLARCSPKSAQAGGFAACRSCVLEHKDDAASKSRFEFFIKQQAEDPAFLPAMYSHPEITRASKALSPPVDLFSSSLDGAEEKTTPLDKAAERAVRARTTALEKRLPKGDGVGRKKRRTTAQNAVASSVEAEVLGKAVALVRGELQSLETSAAVAQDPGLASRLSLATRSLAIVGALFNQRKLVEDLTIHKVCAYETLLNNRFEHADESIHECLTELDLAARGGVPGGPIGEADEARASRVLNSIMARARKNGASKGSGERPSGGKGARRGDIASAHLGRTAMLGLRPGTSLSGDASGDDEEPAP